MTTGLLLPDVPRDRLSVEFFRPDDALLPYVSGYNIYGAYGPQVGQKEFLFPGWTTVRFSFVETPWIIRYGRGEETEVVPATILGASTTDIQSSNMPTGISVGFGITPLGIARLLDVPADKLAGQQTPLTEIWPDADDLRAQIAAFPNCAAVAAFFDKLLLDRMSPPPRDEALVRELMALLVDQHDIDVISAAERLGISEAKLRRVSRQHFGFSPKTLLRRSRFVKSLLAIYGRESGDWSQLIDASYFDQSHFIKDSWDFLGCSPTDFLKHERPMTILSMRRRAEVLGAPMMSLHKSATV